MEGFLSRHGCWDVVDGRAVDDPADLQWVERNQFARCALLYGMLPKDSKKVCKMATAHGMWDSFEDVKTKRTYSSEIRLRRDLYAAKFDPGESMDTYLNRLEDKRRQLANMNAVVPDADMVNIVLQGVVDIHRYVVRMFTRNGAAGAAPDLTTVKNVLLDEDETDRASGNATSAREKTEQVAKVMYQRPVATAENPKKKFKKGGKSKKANNQETRRCFFCKKKGQLRDNCFGWKALQKKKVNDNENDEIGAGKKGAQ